MLDAAHDVVDPVRAPSANWPADWRGGVSGDHPVVEGSCGDLGWGMAWLWRREVGTRTEIACSTGSDEDAGTKLSLVLASPSTLEMGSYSVSMATGCASDDWMGRLGWSCGRIAIRLIAPR